MYANLNGKLVPADEARIPALDHGLLYGDGLFETLRVYGGRFFRLAAHLERLRRGAAQIHLELPWTDAELTEALAATVRENRIDEGALRLTVTRGAGLPVPELAVGGPPAYLVTARPWSGVPVACSACFAGRHPRAFVPGIKSLSYLPFLLARDEARRRGYDEALLTAGEEVVEGSASNVFIVAGGRLKTPPLGSGCLPGVTRAVVLELAAAEGLPAEEAALTCGDLLGADEVFLTGSLAGIRSVARLEERDLPTGCPVTRRLREAFRERVAVETAG